MKHLTRLAAALPIAVLLFAFPLQAQDRDWNSVDWDAVKQAWDTLTPDEQAAYRAIPKPPRANRPSTATILGRPGQKVLTPANTCAGATNEITTLPFMNSGDTSVGFTNDIDLVDTDGMGGACDTTFSSLDFDEAYLVRTDVTCDVTASLASADDEVLVVVTDCGDVLAGCVGATDDGGATEDLTFTATAGTDYFVIADGWESATADGNVYDLSITEATATGCQLVPVELQSFDID